MTDKNLSDLKAEIEAEAQAAAEVEVKKELARELHDRVAQTLTTMVVEMENFKVEQFGRQSVISGLSDLQDSTREVLNSLRRLLYELRGEAVVESDFVESVRTNLLTRFQERTGIIVTLTVSAAWPRRLSSQTALHLYRILDEALNNTRLHSSAAIVEVRFGSAAGGDLTMAVVDDGVGINPAAIDRPGLGTMGMRERAVLLGGRLKIEPNLPRGTLVQAIFPAEVSR